MAPPDHVEMIQPEPDEIPVDPPLPPEPSGPHPDDLPDHPDLVVTD